jgi:hypothetical protein
MQPLPRAPRDGKPVLTADPQHARLQEHVRTQFAALTGAVRRFSAESSPGQRSRGWGALATIACVTAVQAWSTPARAQEWPAGNDAPYPSGPDTAASSPTPPDGWDLADFPQGGSDDRPMDLSAAPVPEAAGYGPPASSEPGPAAGGIEAVPLTRSGHVPRGFASHKNFFSQAGSIPTELLLVTAYLSAQSLPKLFKETTSFRFKDEGWFGKDTANIGVDKLTHAFNTYLLAEILHSRLHRRTDGSEGDAVTAGILATAFMALNEMSDAIEPDSGYSLQDVTMNVAGATFSIMRNTIPGLTEKFAFKIEIIPNGQIYSRAGKRHYAQQRFMFSVKGAGFERLNRTPFKYLDLQVGYFASDFLNSDREKGITPKRHLFVGAGLNLGELLFGRSRSRLGRAAYSVLDYFQVPYTSLRYDTSGN